nr:immunoglobulin light chain junction region [Macaca mulatta]
CSSYTRGSAVVLF